MLHELGLAKVALEGIKTIPDCELDLDGVEDLTNSLSSLNNTPAYQLSAAKAEKVFTALTEKDLSKDQLDQFLNGWRSTHITALYVSGLMIRIQREAFEARIHGESMKAELLSEAAYHIGEIIAEDTGVEGANHNNLFDRFAKGVSGSDDWKLDVNEVPECMKFRRYVENQRTRQPIEEAILTTAASENWNTGEYTFFSNLAPGWIKRMTGQDDMNVKNIAAYVTVHGGTTELDHFTHAIKAWQLYCAAMGLDANPEKAKKLFADYAERVSVAFDALGERIGLKPEAEAAPSARASFLVADRTPFGKAYS